MDFKLSFEEPKYYANPEKGTVTCRLRSNVVIQNCKNELRYAIRYIIMSLCDEDLEYGVESIGVAKLDPKDTFSLEVGKKVARAKAESRAYDFVSKRLCKALRDFIEDVGTSANKFFGKTDSVIEHNNEYLSGF